MRKEEIEKLIFELERDDPNYVQLTVLFDNYGNDKEYTEFKTELEHIVKERATAVAQASIKVQLDQQTILQRKELLRSKMNEMDKYRLPNEEPIEYIIPNDEQILDNEIFDAYCKVLDEDIWKIKNGLADRIAEKSNKQREALIDFDRFQVVAQLLQKLPLDNTLFDNIINVTIPGLLKQEEAAFIPVANTVPQMRTLITNWTTKVPVPFPQPSIPAQELLNTKFTEMLNEYVRKANVYLTSLDKIDG